MIKKIQEAKLEKKIVVLRLDLNIPFSKGKSSDLSRIEKAKETVSFLINNNNKIVILSHFGRPDGQKNKKLSLKNLLIYMQDILKIKIRFFPVLEFERCRKDIVSAPFPSVFLLENLRFVPQEENNDSDFSFKLASLGDVYCNDAF